MALLQFKQPFNTDSILARDLQIKQNGNKGVRFHCFFISKFQFVRISLKFSQVHKIYKKILLKT